MADEHRELSADQARQGVETGTARWVLHISLGLAILAGVILYLIFFGF